MKKFIENFIVFIIKIIMMVIFLGTVYFCLDVFGIIQVPEQYSIASFFYSQIENMASVEALADILPIEENTKKVVVVESEENSETQEGALEEIQARLAKLQNERDASKVHIDEKVAEDTKKFYYNQLDEYGKIIYSELYKNIDKLKTGTYTVEYGTTFNDLLQDEANTEVLNNSFQLAINALTFDNPELFYIDVTKMNLLTEITTRAFSKTYRVSIGGNGKSYLSDEFSNNSVELAIKNVENVKKEIIESATGNTIDKLRIIHDYLVDNTEYDANDGAMVYNIYGTLVNGKSVCEGYARAFKYILDDLEIPCIIACGIGRNRSGQTESHAWNYVQLDGKWYAIDATWDDPVITGGNGILTDDIRYEYFLKGSDSFFKDHFEDGNIVGDAEFRYPEINVEDYKF